MLAPTAGLATAEPASVASSYAELKAGPVVLLGGNGTPIPLVSGEQAEN